MQGTVGHQGNVWLFNVFATHAREHFTVNLQLPIGTVIGGGAYASQLAYHHKQQYCKRRNEDTGFYFHGHSIVVSWEGKISHSSITSDIISL